MKKNPINVSVFIAGGGLVGGVVAAYLKKAGVSFALADPLPPQAMLDAVADGRTTAISLGSRFIFEEADIWTDSLKTMASPIDHIRVLEQDSVYALSFDAKAIGENPMGYIVENMYIRQAILSNLEHEENAFYNTTITNITKEKSYVHITLSDGTEIKAKLLISAEGRNSPTRALIAPQMKMRDYAQTALVVHLEHEKSHNNQAFEVFTPTGPFAILPLKDQNMSGIVYAKPTNFDWAQQTDEQLVQEMQALFPYYGNLKIVSKRWHFPLSVFELNKLTGHRQALVGDAAHGMHPLAGQGVNLGWRDAKEIAERIIKNHQLGIDVGNESLLDAYERNRKHDIKTLLISTDFMNQVFQYDSKTLSFLRQAGLTVVNKIPPLKRFFMKKAMGI